MSALDPDCGQSGEVRYSVAEDLGFAPPAELTLDAASGQLCVALPLDYETTAAYEFPITAADQGQWTHRWQFGIILLLSKPQRCAKK